MQVTKIAVTLSRSIKMAEYQYYKPEIMVEAAPSPGESSTKLYAALYAEAKILLEASIKQEYASFGI